MKMHETATVVKAVRLSEGIYDIEVECKSAGEARPGQFAMIYPASKDTLLGRPISICEVKEGIIRFVFRVVGKGTKEFSELKAGDSVRIIAPLGNGYDTNAYKGKKVTVMGGGIGIPPMLELAKDLNKKGCEVSAVMGYRDNTLFLNEDLEKYAKLYIATEDGSVGTKGNVLDAVKANAIKSDIICACGPMPMLRAIKQYAKENNITAYISLEERMACGVGACLGCVCKTTEKDAHSHVNNARVCTEGPVFNAEDVEI